jgi:hypothetical protein
VARFKKKKDLGSGLIKSVKFCDIKMIKEQVKSTKAGWASPRQVDFALLFYTFSCHLHQAQQKSCPDVFKRLNRSIHYAFRRFHSRINFFDTRRIHRFNES